MDIGEFMAQYWLEFVLGLIVAAISFIARHFYKLQKRDFERRVKDEEEKVKGQVIEKLEAEIQEVRKESHAEDVKILGQMECLQLNQENMTAGVLSMQGKQFRDFCRQLLQPDHFITLDEYEQCNDDHDAYNGLGGNHKGDALFDLVVEKYKAQLKK